MFGWKPAGEGGTEGGLAGGMEPFPFRSNRNGPPDSRFDAFSSREPASASLEIALSCGSCGCFFADCDIERIPLLRPMGRRAVRILGRTSPHSSPSAAGLLQKPTHARSVTESARVRAIFRPPESAFWIEAFGSSLFGSSVGCRRGSAAIARVRLDRDRNASAQHRMRGGGSPAQQIVTRQAQSHGIASGRKQARSPRVRRSAGAVINSAMSVDQSLRR